MSDIEIRVRDELHALADEAPVGSGLWAQTQDRIRVRRRHRRLSFTALATLSAVAAAIIALTFAGGSPKKPTVAVQPTIPKPTLPGTQRRNTPRGTVPTTVPYAGPARTLNGPLSRALQAVVRPLLPSGAKLTQAYDWTNAQPPGAFDDYLLPNGQTLSFGRQRFSGATPSPGDPRSLIADPATDGLTTLPTGSRLAKLGHGGASMQVLLIRPNGTVINVILYAPAAVSTRPSWVSAFSLDSLAISVAHDLDRPSSDVP